MTYDVIVVGIGGMGSAAVYHLARRGVKVLGIEQFDIPHERGSSHGISRIIRLAYAEHPDYVPLLRRAYQLWRELETIVDERLLYVTGGIDAGYEGCGTVRGSLSSCEIHGLPHEQLDAAALNRRFPGYRLADGMVGIYQPDAGFLLSERCIIAHVVVAQQLGAEVCARERVTGLRIENKDVSVTTNRDTYRARKVIVTAGPWARSIVRRRKSRRRSTPASTSTAARSRKTRCTTSRKADSVSPEVRGCPTTTPCGPQPSNRIPKCPRHRANLIVNAHYSPGLVRHAQS
jgi:sarcosine oxidase